MRKKLTAFRLSESDPCDKMNTMKEFKKNEIHSVTIDGYSSEAFGVCHIGGRAVFVPRAIPGEEWEIRIVKVSSAAVYGRGEKLLLPSPARREPDCPGYGKCGGCDCRHMDYDEELRFKLDKVNAALRHIGKQTLQAEEILGSDSVLRYRNKAVFAVAEGESAPAFGFFRERSHELIAVGDCLIQSELSVRAARAVTDFMREHGIPAYDEETGKGVVRHVFCREAVHGSDAIVCVVAARGFGALTQTLAEALRASCPELSGIVLNVNKTRGNTVLAGDFYTLWGEAELHDTLCGLRFAIAPQAFFQINPAQAEKLYRRAAEFALSGKRDLLFDLYCGAGTISLCLARGPMSRSCRRPLKTPPPTPQETKSGTRNSSARTRERPQSSSPRAVCALTRWWSIRPARAWTPLRWRPFAQWSLSASSTSPATPRPSRGIFCASTPAAMRSSRQRRSICSRGPAMWRRLSCFPRARSTRKRFGLSSLWKIWICRSSKMELPIRRSRSMCWSIPG